jgi:hypothetical protein
VAYLLLLIITLFFVNVSLLFYLLIRKDRLQRKEVRKREIKHQVRNLIEKISRGNLKKIPNYYKRTLLFYEALEETVSHYMQLFANEEINRVLKKLANDELTPLYKKRLKNGVWSERMNVLYYIEDFEMASLQDDLWQYYLTKQLLEAERHQVIRSLATLHDERILEEIKHSPDWPHFLYKECFRRFKLKTIHDLLKDSLNDLSEEVQVALLDVAIESKDPTLAPIFDQLLSADSLELRIRALKAIYVFEFTTKERELGSFHQSTNWVERMFFARIAGKMKWQRYSEQLVKLLSDTNWWVRQAAAESIAKYEDGLIILEYVYETNEDQFARDTAYQWLGEAVGQK